MSTTIVSELLSSLDSASANVIREFHDLKEIGSITVALPTTIPHCSFNVQWRLTPGISTEKRIHAYPIAFGTTVLYAHAVWYAGVEYEFRPTLDIVTNKTTKFSFQGADQNDRSYFLFAIGY